MNLQVGVKILVHNADGKYLFMRRVQSFKPGPQIWDIPGGRIEPNEALHDALRREVKEETGMELKKIDTLLSAQDIFVSEKDLHVVRLTYRGIATGDVMISDEHDAYKWMTKDEVVSELSVDSYVLQLFTEKEL